MVKKKIQYEKKKFSFGTKLNLLSIHYMTHLISNTNFEELKYWLAVQELCQAITKATYTPISRKDRF